MKHVWKREEILLPSTFYFLHSGVRLILHMAYNFAPLKTKAKEVEEWLKRELGGVRTGRATPVLLDTVQVEAYDSRMPISQVAAVSVEDARTLRISPWDGTLAKAIEKAIVQANLGVSVAVDDSGLRVAFPELTSERRTQLTKVAKTKFEEARVSLRGERDKVSSDLESKKKEGEISEDEKFRFKAEMQKIIDETNQNLEALYDKKEQEISQ